MDGDDHELDEQMVEIYEVLRRVAARMMRDERPDHTLQPTALVNEAYVRLRNADHVTWADREHFRRLASRVMRNVLVDHERARRALRRGGGATLLSLREDAAPAEEGADVLALDRALRALASESAEAAEVAERKLFGGETEVEIAQAMERSVRTVATRWQVARMWLARHMDLDRG